MHMTPDRSEYGIHAARGLLDSRIIYINKPIDSDTSAAVVAQLLLLEADNAEEDITLCISSEGGSVIDGLAIIDVMDHISCDVSTVGIGLVGSMAALIFTAGTRGKRYALPHTSFLLHQVMSGMPAMTRAEDMRITMDHVLDINEMLNQMLARRTGVPAEQVEKDIGRDFWLNADAAVRYGLADRVLVSKKTGCRKTVPVG